MCQGKQLSIAPAESCQASRAAGAVEASLVFFLIMGSLNLSAHAADSKIELLPLPAKKYSLARTTFAKRTTWLGLYSNGKSGELRMVTLLAKRTTVASYDEGKVPGQYLRIVNGSLPICLFRGLPNNKPRKVTTFYRPSPDRRAVTKNCSFQIKAEGKTPYRVVLRKSKDSKSIDSMVYSLEHGAQRQVLEALEVDPVVGESGLTKRDEILVWCGDIDGDGKADFLTGLNTRSGEALTMQLYLSRGAGKGKIVKPPIRFDYWPPDNPGC